MIISTHMITEEYYDDTLVIFVLETSTGGTKFSTFSAAQEIATQFFFHFLSSTPHPIALLQSLHSSLCQQTSIQ